MLAFNGAFAQEMRPTLSLDLNSTKDVEGGCQISFVVTNSTGTDLDAAVFEAVLMDDKGQVDRLTLFDFAALPSGRPRVRQFVVPQTACAGLGAILINGANRCEAAGAAVPVCAQGLTLSSRVKMELIG